MRRRNINAIPTIGHLNFLCFLSVIETHFLRVLLLTRALVEDFLLAKAGLHLDHFEFLVVLRGLVETVILRGVSIDVDGWLWLANAWRYRWLW